MLLPWTKHIKDAEEKKRFENEIIGSRRVLERLQELLDEEEKLIDRLETTPRIFDQPNWYERQIFYNGFRSCIGMLKKLIDLDQQQLHAKE